MATESMLKFVDRAQAYPAKRTAELRAEDFREIADRYPVPGAEAAGGSLLAMRRALLLGALSASQSYP